MEKIKRINNTRIKGLEVNKSKIEPNRMINTLIKSPSCKRKFEYLSKKFASKDCIRIAKRLETDKTVPIVEFEKPLSRRKTETKESMDAISDK